MKDISIVSFLIVLTLQYIGVARHWFNLRSSKRTGASFFTYLIFGDKKKQGAKLFGIFGSTLLTCQAGIGDWVNPQVLWQQFANSNSINIEALLTAGMFIAVGYAFDSEGNNSKG